MPVKSSDRELRELYERLITAWNRRDAAAMAEQFAEEGNLIGFDGTQVDSCAAIARHLTPIFADHPTPPYVAKVREVRMISSDVGLVRAVAGMIPPGSHDLEPALNTIHTLVAIQDAHRDWRAALFQATPAAWHGRPDDAAALSNELRDVVRRGLTIG